MVKCLGGTLMPRACPPCVWQECHDQSHGRQQEAVCKYDFKRDLKPLKRTGHPGVSEQNQPLLISDTSGHTQNLQTQQLYIKLYFFVACKGFTGDFSIAIV